MNESTVSRRDKWETVDQSVRYNRVSMDEQGKDDLADELTDESDGITFDWTSVLVIRLDKRLDKSIPDLTYECVIEKNS